MIKHYTVCVIVRDGRILLGRKKRGFGEGLWNGFGGKLTPGETPEQAAVRETHEESGVLVTDLRKRGVLTFTIIGNPELMEVHFFSTSEFAGEPVETEEMAPRWFDLDAVPYETMFPDDRHWLPLLLAGKDFGGSALYKDAVTMISHDIHEAHS
jgi:8-oxo-dGTP pyrophosphatase MutT (NUDIX family)